MTATTPETAALTHDTDGCTCCEWCLWMWADCPLTGCSHE